MTPVGIDPSESPSDSADSALALVCTLPPVGRHGRRATVQRLLAQATGWAGHEDGLLLEFPGAQAIARTLIEFVLAERECCPHFTYELAFAPDHRRVTLRLRASGAYVASLKAVYDAP
jgi:hypothetical protein